MSNEWFAERLRNRRKESRLTQEQLAEKMGVTTQTVKNWEQGLVLPEFFRIPVLSLALRVEPAALLPTLQELDKPIGHVSDRPLLESDPDEDLRRIEDDAADLLDSVRSFRKQSKSKSSKNAAQKKKA